MGKHARLSPSGAKRWIGCPASVRMANHPDAAPKESTNRYAQEGTLAHGLGEIKAAAEFGIITRRTRTRRLNKWRKEADEFGLTEDGLVDMERHTDAYVALLQTRADLLGPHTTVLLEQRMDAGLPECWGTSDAVLITPEIIEIWDLKYGQGIPVSPEKNPQLRLYALGALDTYGDLLGDVGIVRMGVFQPRTGDGQPRYEEMDVHDLRAWRKSILPVAMEALGPDARFGPSEDACRYCPAAGICKPRADHMLALDFGTKVDEEVIGHEELAELLGRLPDVRQWCDDVHAAAMRLMYDKEAEVPGWKVVLGHGRRRITDQDRAYELLVHAGFSAEEIADTKLKGLGVLDKVTEGALGDLLGGLLEKKPGAPGIVKASDGRQPVSARAAALEDFGDSLI